MKNKHKKLPELACQMCFPGAIDIGYIAGTVWLSKIKGRYVLFYGQGHRDDDIHTFRIKPFGDPTREDPKCKKDITNKLHRKACDYSAKHFNFTGIGAFGCYQMIRDCMKWGHYRPKTHGFNFDIWLFFKCGEAIEKYERSLHG